MKAVRFRLQHQHQSFDIPLLLTVLVLICFGLLMVYDSSAVQALRDYNDSYYYIRQQIIWVVLGSIAALFLANFPYHKLKTLAVVLMGLSLILMVAVFIPGLGVSGGGAHRWLKLGPVALQPAELVKLTGVIFLATIFEKGVRFLPVAGLTVLVAFVTAVLQKDLGTTVVFVATVAAMYYGSGGSIVHFLAVIPIAVVAFLGLVLTSEYRSKRILAFLNPFSDPQGYTYHISQVLIALGSGGLLGVGLGKSRQKFEYIPEVTTDSIFAVIGEELGFAGGLFLITLFAILVFRGLRIATHARDSFGRNLALGLTSWLGLQAIINLSSMVSLLPLTGVPLPFISYGGSALVANMMAIGILLNISKNTSH